MLTLTACGNTPHPLTPDEAKVAETGAMAFAVSKGGSFVSCNATDFNSDGYVVCQAKNSFGDQVRLRCRYKAGDRIGCTQG